MTALHIPNRLKLRALISLWLPVFDHSNDYKFLFQLIIQFIYVLA